MGYAQFVLRLLFFLGLGILGGSALAMLVGPPGAGAWTITLGLLVCVFSGLLVRLSRSGIAASTPPPALVAAATGAGRIGLARVDALTQTNTQINDQPVCRIEFTVLPRSGPAYRIQLTRIVPIVSIPLFQPDSVHEVAILAEGRPDIAILEHRGAAADTGGDTIPAPESAGSLLMPSPGGLRADGTPAKPLIGIGAKGRWWRIIAYVLMFAIGVAIIVWPYRTALAQSVQSVSQGDLHADLRTAEFLPETIDTILGDADSEQLTFAIVTKDYVILDAPVAEGATDTDRWMYRRGVLDHEGPSSMQPETAQQHFDAADVDWAALWPAARQAAASVDLADQLDDVSLQIERASDHDTDSDTYLESTGPVEVRFSLSDDYGHDTSFVLAADGSLVSGPDEG